MNKSSIQKFHYTMKFLNFIHTNEGPDGGDSDGDIETNLTPRTEAKYNKIDEEFQIMMKHRNQGNGNGGQNLQTEFGSMPVSVPVCSESQFGSDSSSQHDPGHQGK